MVSTLVSQSSNLFIQKTHGSIVRLELGLGFGYVCDAMGENRYIFVIGKAIKHVDASTLYVGAKVSFQVQGQGVISELSLV